MMKLFWPFATRRDAPISQAFGARPEVYEPLTGRPGHSGIDFAVPVGTPVRCMAPTEGHVVQTDRNGVGLLGIYVLVEHEPFGEYDKGYQTLYAHLDQRRMHHGMQVSPGQHLGLSGNTGNSTGPHLHAGFKDLRYRSDPAKFNGYLDFAPFLCKNDEDVGVDAYVVRNPRIRDLYGLDEAPGVAGDDGNVNWTSVGPSQKARDRAAMNQGAPPSAQDPLPLPDELQAKRYAPGPVQQIKALGKVSSRDGAGTAAAKHVVREASQLGRIAASVAMIVTVAGSALGLTPEHINLFRNLASAVAVTEGVPVPVEAQILDAVEPQSVPAPVEHEPTPFAVETPEIALPAPSVRQAFVAPPFRIRMTPDQETGVILHVIRTGQLVEVLDETADGYWYKVVYHPEGYAPVTGWVYRDGVAE